MSTTTAPKLLTLEVDSYIEEAELAYLMESKREWDDEGTRIIFNHHGNRFEMVTEGGMPKAADILKGFHNNLRRGHFV